MPTWALAKPAWMIERMDSQHKGCQCCCGASASKPGQQLFEDGPPQQLDEEQERFKRALYEKMNPRRRKFVDRIGYDQWDPFQAPKDPLDIRTDRTSRTLQDLLREFMADSGGRTRDAAWQAGARQCALGIIQKDEKFQGIFDFCLWYAKLLERENNERMGDST